jgi:hypothetical protein
MPFQKGRSKTGGRKVGAHNKIQSDVRAMLDALGCNPIQGLSELAHDPTTPKAIKAHCLSTLAKYVHPQLQSIQHSGIGGGPIQVADVSALELIRAGITRVLERRGT